MSEPRLGLRRWSALGARLTVRTRGSRDETPAGCVPLPGSELLLATTRRLSLAGLRVERAVRAPRLGAETWTRAWAALLAGDTTGARAAFARTSAADALFLAAALSLVGGKSPTARSRLEDARRRVRGLGSELRRCNLEATLWITAPGGLVARIQPDRSGVLLALALLEGRTGRASPVLDDLVRLASTDVGVRLLACNALLAGGSPATAAARRILSLSEGEPGDHAASTLILLFRARALRRLGRAGAARRVCALASARGPGRAGLLGAALRLEHAAAHTDLGEHALAQRKLLELARLSPGFATRAQRDGIEWEVKR